MLYNFSFRNKRCIHAKLFKLLFLMFKPKNIFYLVFGQFFLLLCFSFKSYALDETTKDILNNIYQIEKDEAEREINFQDYELDYIQRQREAELREKEKNRKQRRNIEEEEDVLGFDIIVKDADPHFVKIGEIEQRAYDSLLAGEYENAVILYSEVLVERPEDENLLAAIGVAYHKLGDFVEAESYYAQALSFNSKNKIALYNFLALVAERDPEEALIELYRLGEVKDDDAYIYFLKSLIFFKQDEIEKSKSLIEQALSLEPNNYLYRYNYAVTLDYMKEYKQAKQQYFEIIKSIAENEKKLIPYVKVKQRYNVLNNLI